VSFYSATLTVKPAGSGSEVEWIGRFYRGDTSNFPPENLNDEAATKAMTALFREGLDGLKAKLEGKP
jgi:mxaD protein